MLDEHGFRKVADELYGIIDDRLRHASNGVPLDQIREFARFHNISHDMCARNCHFVSQPGHIGAMRSGGRDKNLQVKILL